jgi:hypothetical protein
LAIIEFKSKRRKITQSICGIHSKKPFMLRYIKTSYMCERALVIAAAPSALIAACIVLACTGELTSHWPWVIVTVLASTLTLSLSRVGAWLDRRFGGSLVRMSPLGFAVTFYIVGSGCLVSNGAAHNQETFLARALPAAWIATFLTPAMSSACDCLQQRSILKKKKHSNKSLN